MSKTAHRTDPKLWEKVKAQITRSAKGGEPGQWSARKAQLAVQEYKKRGGGYLGETSGDSSPKQWAGEDRGTKSGLGARATGERYLPKKARQALPDSGYREGGGKKPAGGKASGAPKAVAEKTTKHRSAAKASARPKRPGQNKGELLVQARYLDIEGRSNMLKSELLDAIRLAKH